LVGLVSPETLLQEIRLSRRYRIFRFHSCSSLAGRLHTDPVKVVTHIQTVFGRAELNFSFCGNWVRTEGTVIVAG